MPASADDLKRRAAGEALKFVETGMRLGLGTGSTAAHFVRLLGEKVRAGHLDVVGVPTSEATHKLAVEHGVPLTTLDETPELDLTVDGADELDSELRLIKGGGGAHTREKIVASASRKFVCIVDKSKQVGVLGAFPLPVEVIPMGRSYVSRQMVVLGGQPELREGLVTDNGNEIIDVHNLDLVDPVRMEEKINNIAGVVACGLFAIRPADVVLMASDDGVEEL
jgi:ribose 5-phosphate isomerase A